MEKIKQLPKQYLIIGGVILVLLLVTAYFMFPGNKSSDQSDKESVFQEPTEVIPTVDSSVKVTIEGNQEGVITVDGIPDGTTQIEYQLTYNKKNLIEGEGLQDGLFGRIKIKNNEKKVEEKVTFGTCSSGVCRYHNIDGAVDGVFRFTGNYGKKILEKKFNLE